MKLFIETLKAIFEKIKGVIMPIYKGSAKVGTIYRGGTKIGKVYKGSTQVYSGQLSVYNIYGTNQERGGFCGFFLGEPGANKMVVGGTSQYLQQNLLTGIIGTITSISGTPGTAGSSLYFRIANSNSEQYTYRDNYNDSYGGVWYRYAYDGGYFNAYVLLSPFHTTVGSQLISVASVSNAVFSSDASTITYSAFGGDVVYNTASTLRGTFQYK